MNDKFELVSEAEDQLDTVVENEINHEEIEESSLATKNVKIKKHKEAVRLVNQAKKIVTEAEEQTEACKLLLAGDLKEYEQAKESLNNGGLDACNALMEKLGYMSKVDNKNDDKDILVFEPKEEVAPIVLKNVSSGKFTGLLYALIGGVLTSGGLIYLAIKKLALTIDFTKIPTIETMQNILSWFSTVVGLESNVYVGSVILVLVSLLVMVAIYLMRVGFKGNKNLHFAVKQLVEAELYTEKKSDCKSEMDKVDAHIKETVTLLKTYEILFNEQKGKLERILHIEGSKVKSSDYHEKSFLEIHETKELIRSIKDFIATPMSKEGKLSERSVSFLAGAKTQMDKMLERLY